MRTAYTSKEFDRDVSRLIDEWEGAAELQAEWASYDGEQRAVVIDEWQHTISIQLDVEGYAGEHELTEDQKTQYARLNETIAAHADTLRKMGYRVLPLKEGKGRAVA